jgi:hypothetical protein
MGKKRGVADGIKRDKGIDLWVYSGIMEVL